MPPAAQTRDSSFSDRRPRGTSASRRLRQISPNTTDDRDITDTFAKSVQIMRRSGAGGVEPDQPAELISSSGLGS
jgi:hypothetical protein